MRQNINISDFDNWNHKVIENVKERIKKLKKYGINHALKSIFNDLDVRIYLLELHKHFVFVPIEKSLNEVAIIWK